MPKRISDVSLHVYVTPETLEHIVDTVRELVDDHLQDRDVFAWRFTLPVDADDPAHCALESRWRAANPGRRRSTRGTYEIALSLVGAPTELTDADIAALEDQLRLGIHAVGADREIPFTIRALQRTDVDLDRDPDHEHI